MKTQVDVQSLVNAAATKPNWTGLNAIQLYCAGRLTASGLRQWAKDSANEDSAAWFDSNDLAGGMKTWDEYVRTFVETVERADS